MNINDGFWAYPGQTAVLENKTAAITWGRATSLITTPGIISSAAIDAGNTPTTYLRSGLLLGMITASKKWTNYSPTATDGSQVAAGILPFEVNTSDFVSGSVTNKYVPICVGGLLHSSGLIGLDNWARAQLASRFTFDDNFVGNALFPYLNLVAKAADYTVVAADNLTLFTTLGAGAAVNFTLPALAPGLSFTFLNLVNQNMTITSAAGNDIVAMNDLSATSVAFSTANEKIGASVRVFSNPAGTKWFVQNQSAGVATITVT